MLRDLQQLPKLSDSISYLYIEHAALTQDKYGLLVLQEGSKVYLPVAALTVLLLGPGTRTTHAAIKTLADNGCTVVWVGEDGTRYYAHGRGETRRARHLLHQARLVSDPRLRLEVCRRMYRHRFQEPLEPHLTLQQLRGMEGARVRTAYAQASVRHNVPWEGRRYRLGQWERNDPINRALSAANALLNGLCHAAIVAGGYSPALGFIHTGNYRSFVYDIADLYKVEITIPTAFRVVGESTERVEPRVRQACRAVFKEQKLLQRILPDIAEVLDVPEPLLRPEKQDAEPGEPKPLWDPPPEVEAALLEQIGESSWS